MPARRGKWHPPPVPMPRIIHLPRRSRLSRLPKVAAKASKSPSASASLPSSSSSSIIGLRRASRRPQAKASSDVISDAMALWEGLAAMRGEEKALVALCCSVSMSAHRSPSSPFLLRTVSHPFPAAVFTFPASWSADDWILAGDRGGPFGESEIDASLFPSLRNIGNDVAARVNGAFLRSFQRLLKESWLQAEVERSGRRRGSESFRELQRSNARNFDQQASVLRRRLEKMVDETSVREIREIAATEEKQYSDHHCRFLFISPSVTCKNTVGSGV